MGDSLYDGIEQEPEENFIPAGKRECWEDKAFQRFQRSIGAAEFAQEYSFFRQELFGALHKCIIAAFLQGKEENELIVRSLFEAVRELPLRVCIFDMQQKKQEGALQGETTEEEYAYYCKNLLEDSGYLKELCGRYPEMVRLFWLRLRFRDRYLSDFFTHLKGDRKMLEREICGGEKLESVSELKADASDSHNDGKAVILCRLDHGEKIVYKPHGVKKEILYRNLYHWFCKKPGLSVMEYFMYDGGDYGWEEYLEHKPCEEKCGIERYFIRMGIHLFLCTLLNGSDMHQENILAVGEYPVVLDVETLPGIRMKRDIRSAEDRIRAEVQDSVLRAGILPVPVWQNGEDGVMLSALYRGEAMRTAVQVPVIEKPGTSEMCITYRRIPVTQGNSLPVWNGKRADPGKYTEQLRRGFTLSYRLWMESQEEVETLLEPFWEEDTRFLLRHTQQYHMYLSSSLHPVFLQNTEYRLMMLQVLQKGNRDMDMVRQEIGQMFQMDIPFFSCGGKEWNPYFRTSVYECYRERAEETNEADLDRQLELINLSMEMAAPENRINRYFEPEEKEPNPSCPDIDAAIRKILLEVEKKAVLEQGDICWKTMHCESSYLWQIRPVDLSFYNGISGIAVFLALAKRAGFGVNDRIYGQTMRKLSALIDREGREDRRTGLMFGEGSIAYACLLLYQITGKKRFWEYAKKQALWIEKLYPEDVSHDLPGGNAGAILVLTEMYRQSKEGLWLELAVKIGDDLWKKAVRQERGYGWITQKGAPALSGMSHGNSGFLSAYAALLEFTQEERYQEIIRELLLYEDSLYFTEEGNWKDLRYPGIHAYSNAWCHGAAGILLSRLKLAELKEFENDPAVREDIINAAGVLFSQSERKGLCLCHGMAGNYWIMTEYAKAFGVDREQDRAMRGIRDRILKKASDWTAMLPQDRQDPGMMTGIAGIGSVLVEMKAKNQVRLFEK